MPRVPDRRRRRVTRQAGGPEPPQLRASEISRDQATDPRKRNPKARQSAVGLAPSGARKLWLWIVGRCVYCGGAPAHRGGAKCGVRRAGCGKGEYEIAGRRPR
jgi:hypothetical protein